MPLPAKRLACLDLETFRFGLEHGPLPHPVTYAIAWRDPDTRQISTWLFGNGDEGVEDYILRMLEDEDLIIVGHNFAFDLAVLHIHHPRLRVAIWAALAAGRLRCTLIQESLLRVATTGKIRKNKHGEPLKLAQAALESAYLGIDRSAAKENELAVRVRYAEVDGLPASRYREIDPAFDTYPREDVSYCLQIAECQEAAPGSLTTRELHLAANLSLELQREERLHLHPAQVEHLGGMVDTELDEAKLGKLIRAGIMRPAMPPRPFGNGAQDHAEGCDRHGCACYDIQPKRKRIDGVLTAIGYQRKHAKGCERPRCTCPPMMTEADPASINTKMRDLHVVDLCRKHEWMVPLTETGQETLRQEKVPVDMLPKNEEGEPQYVSVAGEVLNQLAVDCPIMYEYRHRHRLQKIAQFVGRMRAVLAAGFDYIVPSYRILLETGRVSASGVRKGQQVGSDEAPLPAENILQIPNPPKKRVEGLEFLYDLDARTCITPPPGELFVNADFSSLELVTTAQTTWDLFGREGKSRCVHRELINEGVDLHAFFGAQIPTQRSVAVGDWGDKYRALPDFRRAVRRGDRREAYEVFARLKLEDPESEAYKFYKRMRNMAKPETLGLIGGLGAYKLAYKIAPQYDVDMDQATAEILKRLWLETFVEMVLYFRWIDSQLAGSDTFHYTSRFGFVRNHCGYCAACNGKAMQTPGAEAAKLALFYVGRAAYDPSQGSLLLGRFKPNLFVHDEIGGRTPDDHTAPYVAMEVGRLMEKGLKAACPDVEGKAEPLLAYTWRKKNEPKYDARGLLIPCDEPLVVPA
ncbi:MAG: hypothetical protein GY716_16115 [bacterium]|nr:hypothetical protein [bacterium]